MAPRNDGDSDERDCLTRLLDLGLEHGRRRADLDRAVAALAALAPVCWLVAAGMIGRVSLLGRFILTFTALVSLLAAVTLVRVWRSGRRLDALRRPPAARARQRRDHGPQRSDASAAEPSTRT